MKVMKWLHSLVRGDRVEITQAATAKKAEEYKKKNKRASSVDLVNAALIDKAEDLDELIMSGSGPARRKKIKNRIRLKVESVIADEFKNPEIIEEVTERIVNAAEIDPYYERLFG